MEEALLIAADIGKYPIIIRPAFTLGGTGGGIAYNIDELKEIVTGGLDASMTNQVCPRWELLSSWARVAQQGPWRAVLTVPSPNGFICVQT